MKIEDLRTRAVKLTAVTEAAVQLRSINRPVRRNRHPDELSTLPSTEHRTDKEYGSPACFTRVPPSSGRLRTILCFDNDFKSIVVVYGR